MNLTKEQALQRIAALEEYVATFIPLEKCPCGKTPKLSFYEVSGTDGTAYANVICECGLRLCESTNHCGYDVTENELRINCATKWNNIMKGKHP